MELWILTQLEDRLEKLKNEGRITQWSMRTDILEREEKYFIQDAEKLIGVDQERTVSESLIFAKLTVPKGEKQGSAQKQFFRTEELEPQVQALIAAATMGKEDIWSYEKKPAQAAISQNRADPLISENVKKSADRMSASLVGAVQNMRHGKFNSAELFVSRKQTNLRLSNGFRGDESSAQIYAEVCFSNKDAATNASDEFLITKSGAKMDQFNFDEMCGESAEYSLRSLRTEKPRPGKYAVLLSAEDLCPILHGVLPHLNSASKYLGTPFVEKGAEFIPNFGGTPFRLSLDPEMNHAFGSRGFDDFGDPQKRLSLVENNRIAANITSKKISDFLGVPKSTTCGVLVLEPAQAISEQQLRRSEPVVLEILQFSGLFVSSSDLTFASEIRLARLHDARTGQVSYIKGGSISGNFRENFSKVRWSDRKVLRNNAAMGSAQSYYGPTSALLMDVNVTA